MNDLLRPSRKKYVISALELELELAIELELEPELEFELELELEFELELELDRVFIPSSFAKHIHSTQDHIALETLAFKKAPLEAYCSKQTVQSKLLKANCPKQTVMPAKAGIQCFWKGLEKHWMPAFAGMTVCFEQLVLNSLL